MGEKKLGMVKSIGKKCAFYACEKMRTRYVKKNAYYGQKQCGNAHIKKCAFYALEEMLMIYVEKKDAYYAWAKIRWECTH